MDTDDLSTETYKAIIIQAEKFNHDLTSQFGCMADGCDNEKEYLLKAKKLIKAIQEIEEHQISDMFFDAPPNKKSLLTALKKILAKISAVEKIPEDKRHYDF